ncbi:hypothetical protein HYC85_029065 [Camellia sinensis]|uniref:Aminotransferase-like plant mobile domain-containing protein n=1 Tax=Camellia sinensis TaxID=4442 RepID=A0A7J7G0V1_CAMSI|nr:hypothetical protein HYC85_029065 [Camellia sinensis]
MADDLPQGGAPPELEMDPEAEPLPPHIRPFDPETYRPAVHVMLPDGLRQFRSFDRHVPPELLLRNTVARDWYLELPDAVRDIVDEAGFGIFCRGLSRLTTCRPLLAALAERWWDTTDSFHFSVAGDMTMTPYDFSMLTGIGVGGDPIPFDTDMDEWDAAQLYLLGTQPHLARAGFVRQIRHYDWGGAALTTLYSYMSSSSRLSGQLLGGYWRAWELWVYAYFPRLAPVADEEIPLGIPFSHRFDVRCVRRPRQSLIFFHRYFDTITTAEITWQPWAPLPAVVRDHYEGSGETARCRILLEGPVCQAWYLGERFMRQTLGLPEQIVPGPPPAHMRDTERFTAREMRDYTVGWGAEHHRGEGDYAEYVRTYIMRPLSGGRRAEGERPAAPAAGAGAGAGAGTSRRARVHGRSGARGGRGTGWPALPTASSGYTRQSVELNASMMGMLQRTFDLLALYSIPPPFQIPLVGGAPAGPSIPARGGRGDTARPRTRGGHIHVGSSSRVPTPDDDDDDDDESEAEAEAGQAVSTGNFPFWVRENGPILENGIVFEKIVNLSKNFQKLFLQTTDAQRAWNLLFEIATSDRRQWKIAPGLKNAAWQRKVAPGLNNDSWERKVAPCLDDAAVVRKQSSLVMVELLDTKMTKTVITDIWTQSPWKVLVTRLWDEVETIVWTETL